MIFLYLILSFLLIISLLVIFSKSLILTGIYLGLYSLFSVILYFILNAPDVALTEACIGVFITSLFYFIIVKFILSYNHQKKTS